MEVIIFEGIDHTGKSTRIQKVKEELEAGGLKVKVVAVDGSHPNTFEAFKNEVERAEEEGFNVIIFDRWAIGEILYGNSYRVTSRISLEEIIQLLDTYESTIYIRYVKEEDFPEYAKRLEFRDFGVLITDEEHLKNIYDVKRVEQGFFKALVDVINCSHAGVQINEDYFNVSDDYE